MSGSCERLGVIFDVDGVLVDSYHAHRRSWLELAGTCGVAFTDADFASTFGMTSREIIRRYWPEADHTDERVSALDGEKEDAYRSLVTDDFPVMDGAVGLIDSLVAEGFLIGAGSSGPPENVHLALKNIGRMQCFAAVVTSVDVREGKPNPEVFTTCVERMGIPPSRCVVIEDAPAGVLAARRAGMRSVALLSTGREAADFAGSPPDKMVKNLQYLSPTTLAQTILEK